MNCIIIDDEKHCIKTLSNLLGEYNFFRIHHSSLINLK